MRGDNKENKEKLENYLKKYNEMKNASNSTSSNGNKSNPNDNKNKEVNYDKRN